MNARLLGWSAAALFSLSACSGLTGEARTDHTNLSLIHISEPTRPY